MSDCLKGDSEWKREEMKEQGKKRPSRKKKMKDVRGRRGGEGRKMGATEERREKGRFRRMGGVGGLEEGRKNEVISGQALT